MRKILFAAILLAGCWAGGKELSAAVKPAIRARENFHAALLTNDKTKKCMLLLAALEDAPDSDLYFQELSNSSPGFPLRLKAGERLLKLAKKHPQARFVILGGYWNRFVNMDRQEIIDLMDLVLDNIPADDPAGSLIFERKLDAVRSEGDFSALKDLVKIRRKTLLIPIAKFACTANFFEPETYGPLWQTVLKNLKESEDDDHNHLMRLESFYYSIGDFASTHRLRRIRIPSAEKDITMEVTLLAGQERFDEAFKVIETLKNSDPKRYADFSGILTGYRQTLANPAANPVTIPVEKLLPRLDDPKLEVKNAAATQLLYHAEKNRDTGVYRKVRAKLLPHAAEADILNALGYVGVELNEQVAENRKLIEKALTLEPHNFAYLDSLAWAQFRQGEFRQAAATIRRALYSVPATKEAFDQLGTLFMHAGDIETALKNHSAAVRFYRNALRCTGDKELDRKTVEKKIKQAEAAK